MSPLNVLRKFMKELRWSGIWLNWVWNNSADLQEFTLHNKDLMNKLWVNHICNFIATLVCTSNCVSSGESNKNMLLNSRERRPGGLKRLGKSRCTLPKVVLRKWNLKIGIKQKKMGKALSVEIDREREREKEREGERRVENRRGVSSKRSSEQILWI